MVTMMTPSTTAGNSDRAFLAHAVSTLGAALRSLERIEDQSIRGYSVEVMFAHSHLSEILDRIREDERNARHHTDTTGGIPSVEAKQP